MIYNFDEHSPSFVGTKIFVAPGADIIGRVSLAEDSSVWFNATLRGDLEPISVGRGSNIQDGSSVHTDMGYPVIIGENVTVGHNCVIHGCVIGDGSLIGMGAVILTGARIGRNCLIGAGALLTGTMDVPDGMMVLGAPAKTIKSLTEEAISKCHQNSAHYVEQKDAYLRQGIGLVKG
ncbi:MAG: gamma carbonic anhydrase family protein [Spirochaeta sp. LUC14_002_19_P3]|nr:MAG: gamma carbonic anhydrase family protein [Spirochaeta sp. LUC14_002_19_P3]